MLVVDARLERSVYLRTDRSPMRTSVLLCTLLLTPALALAQTYYYVSSIAVAPPAPTEEDPITITVNGDLSSTAASIESVTHTIVGNTVNITINATTSGIGLDILVPHTEQVELGMLTEGDYTINLLGSFILDMAPQPQHLFTVTRTDLPACDSLDILSLEWSPFTDTALVLHVVNSSSNIFAYPGFLLYDQEGDTLAEEIVNAIGIGVDSWHTLTVNPGADLSNPSFVGGLELWTGFYSEQACAWNIPVELCPTGPCSPLYPTMVNTGGGMTEGVIPWQILDDQNVQVASGSFVMDQLNQIDNDTACLPPGDYTLVASYPDQLLGQPQIYIASPNWQASTPSQPFQSGGQANNHPFTFYGPCAGSNSIEDHSAFRPPVVMITDDQLVIQSADQRALGQVQVNDATGKLIASTKSTEQRWHMPIAALSAGLYLATVTSPAGIKSTVRFVHAR
jgi:hypothetical protein